MASLDFLRSPRRLDVRYLTSLRWIRLGLVIEAALALVS